MDVILNASATSCYASLDILLDLNSASATITNVATFIPSFTYTSQSSSSGTLSTDPNVFTNNLANGTIATITFTLSTGQCIEPQITGTSGFDCSFSPCEPATFLPSPVYCPGPLYVAGGVRPRVPGLSGYDMPDVTVRADVTGSPFSYSTVASYAGNPPYSPFAIALPPNTAGLEVTTYVDPNLGGSIIPDDCGVYVDADDVVLLQYFILGTPGVGELNAAQKLATDANNSGFASSYDAILIRRAYFGYNSPDFKNFYYSVIYPTVEDLYLINQEDALDNSFSYTGSHVSPSLVLSPTNIGFAAVKIGDVDQNCPFDEYDSLQEGHSSEEKSSTVTTLSINIPDPAAIIPGKEFSVPIHMADYDPFSVLSFQLEVASGFKIIGLDNGILNVNSEENNKLASDGSSFSIFTLPSDRLTKSADLSSDPLLSVRLIASENANLKGKIFSLHPFNLDRYAVFSENRADVSNLVLFPIIGEREFDELHAKDQSVWPNPFINSLTLSWPEAEQGKGRITIINQLGQTVMQKSLSIRGRQLQLNGATVTSMHPGAYLFKLTLPSGTSHTYRVVKQ